MCDTYCWPEKVVFFDFVQLNFCVYLLAILYFYPSTPSNHYSLL